VFLDDLFCDADEAFGVERRGKRGELSGSERVKTGKFTFRGLD